MWRTWRCSRASRNKKGIAMKERRESCEGEKALLREQSLGAMVNQLSDVFEAIEVTCQLENEWNANVVNTLSLL
ncbi:hypothetical protein VNO80_19445 [Phaseolus coccineus]|uniref:Uncharacterized protein n=1 Tax=Phaseolus coccineus TaxID=3886 RepID=A0AAN9R0N1_PHACN